MRGERIKVIRAVPSPTATVPIVTRFCTEGGVVTSFEDAQLPALLQAVAQADDVEVLPFGMVVARALRAAGEDCLPLASSAQQISAIGRAAETSGSDSPLRRVARFPGTRKAIARTIKELAEWGVEPNGLRRAADRSVDSADKFNVLADLTVLSNDLLSKIGRELSSAQLERCLEATSDPEYRIERMLVFVSSDAPALKSAWLKWMVSQGCEVTVVVPRHAGSGVLFQGVAKLAETLGADCIDIGSGNRLTQSLFSDEAPEGPPFPVRIMSAADPLSECEWVVRTCASAGEMRQAIYVRNLETYGPLLELASIRLGLPLSIHRRTALLDNSFAQLTSAILGSLGQDDVRPLRALLGSSYLGLTADERAFLEAALLRARAHRSALWQTLESDLEGQADRFAWLREVLKWRASVADGSATMGEWVQQLTDLVGMLPWHQALETAAGYDSERDARAFTAMQVALANDAALLRVDGGPSMNLTQFATRCDQIWSSADVSLPAREGIPVVSSAYGLGEADVVYALGMVEGAFPRRRTEDPILGDQERREISDLLGLAPLLPSSFDEAATERDEFYRLCAAPRQGLVFSYPVFEEDRENIPAFYLSLVKRTFKTSVEVDPGIACAGPPRADAGIEIVDFSRMGLAPSVAGCANESDRRLAEAFGEPYEEPLSNDLVLDETRMALAKSREAGLTPEELRDVQECPFRYQFRQRINLQPNGRSAQWTRLRRLPELARLPELPDRASMEAAMAASLESELEQLFPKAQDWELRVLRSGGQRLIRDWIRNELLARSLWPRDLGSVAMRPSYGEAGLRHRFPGGILVRGTVSAKYTLVGGPPVIRLISRTAKSSAELTESEKLHYGILFLALHEQGTNYAIEVDGMDGKRSLLVLSREGFVGLGGDAKSGLRIVDLAQSTDDVDSKKRFFEEVKSLLVKAAERIEKGMIRPTPGDHCEWCDLGELCRSSHFFGEIESPFGEDLEVGE